MVIFIWNFHINRPSFYFANNFLYKCSIAKAPIGAVNTIDNTAMVNTRLPQLNPNANGIPPIAACTVAFGVYAIIVNILSFQFKLVLISEIPTPIILNNKTSKIRIIPKKPAFFK